MANSSSVRNDWVIYVSIFWFNTPVLNTYLFFNFLGVVQCFPVHWCNLSPCILVQLLHVQACFCSIVADVCCHTWFWSDSMTFTVDILRHVYCELVTTSTSISTFVLPSFWDGAKFPRAWLIWNIYTERVVARTQDDMSLTMYRSAY